MAIVHKELVGVVVHPANNKPAGTNDYTELKNKPAIDGHTLTLGTTSEELGLVKAELEKGLSTNDFTTEEKQKLAGIDLQQYVDKETYNKDKQTFLKQEDILQVVKKEELTGYLDKVTYESDKQTFLTQENISQVATKEEVIQQIQRLEQSLYDKILGGAS